ncbi:MAG: ABC transporter ATP-binding protein [Bacteroidetes bacterium]|nr:ABC transporter ATP-binding protein [Bacteroidota bacterium]
MSDIAIKIENLSKQYRLGVIGTGTLSHDLNRWWKMNILGKEDPYLKIGETNQRDMKGTSDYVWALRDINLEVKKGEVLGIIGKNGAGKSTLLKILSRVTKPSTGKITYKGRIASLLEVGTGFHPEMTGRENIYMNGTIMGMTRSEISRKLDEIVDFAGIERYIDTPVKRYSSGMTVRLGFAIAAHLEPEILVVDEVLAVGDAEFQKKAIGKMQDVSKNEGRTVLFVSHNMGAIESLCNSGVLLQEGKLIKNYDSLYKLIQFYLNDSIKFNNINYWYNEENKFDDEYFTPRRFFISNSKIIEHDGVLSNNGDYFIIIEAEIKKIDNALTIGYSVFDEKDNCIFWSYQTDSQEEDWPIIRQPGNYKFKTKFPKRLLNEGRYRVELIGGLHNIKWIFEPQKLNPYFYVEINGGLSDSIYYTQKRNSIIAPIFKWEIETLK